MLEVWERSRMGSVHSFLLLLSRGMKFQSQHLRRGRPRVKMTLNRLLNYTYHRRVWFSLCNSEQPFFCKVKLENL